MSSFIFATLASSYALNFTIALLGLWLLCIPITSQIGNSTTHDKATLTFPVVGHIAAFFKDHDALYSRAREYFGNTREPFSLTIMGQSMYIVSSASDVSAIYKVPKALSSEPFIHDIMMSFGIPRHEVDKMFVKDFSTGGKSYMDVTHDHLKLQLHPGEKLEVVQSRMLGRTDELMQWEHLTGRMVVAQSSTMSPKASQASSKIISLYEWTQEFIVDATTRAFFDEKLYELAPDILPQFFIFEDESWKLPMQFPEFAAKKLYASKNYIQDALLRYLDLPQDQLPGNSWLVQRILLNMEALGLHKSHRGQTMFGLFRTANANAYKTTFWMLAHILFDAEVNQEVRCEIDPAFAASGKLDMEHLINSAPLLNSLYEETIRVYNSPIGFRTVMEPTVINGKRLRVGRTLFMPYRQLHYDPRVFGDDAHHFNPKRFMRDPGLSKSTSFRPFGGSTSWCPGRFVARREVLLFVAAALKRFELEVVTMDGGKPSFPLPDDGLPTGGSYALRVGERVLVRVSPVKK